MDSLRPFSPAVDAEIFETMVGLRRDLHRHPELSWQERRTMERISAQLTALGIPHQAGFAGTGVVADLPGEKDGPRVALRADTDALPIQEETGAPYASVHDGVMHACGHDGHTSMLMGAAALLTRGPLPPRPLRLIWQPAEERGMGAEALIEAGVLDGVALIFGGHLDRSFPAGTLAVTEGTVNASTDTFRLTIQGRSSHGARPHEGIDAIVAASHVVCALQTAVSRELDPGAPAVLTIGRFDAGTTANIVAGQARLDGTMRSHSPAVRAHMMAAIERIAQATAAAHGASATLDRLEGCPPLINTAPMTALAREAALKAVGPERVDVMRITNMGGEDFASYLEKIPGCYIRIGGRLPGPESPPAHSSRFDFDEGAMAAGAAWYYQVAHAAGRWLEAEG